MPKFFLELFSSFNRRAYTFIGGFFYWWIFILVQ